MASEREQKQLEGATESLSGRVFDLKSSLGQLILKLETDPTLNWHSFLDSYALISSQMTSLLKTMKHEKTPSLKRYITLPLMLSPDRDEELLKITEHRVHTFSHDLVPDYLRTKPDPEIEARHNGFESKAAGVSADAQSKQLSVMDKITRDTLKLITREKEEMDAKSAGRAEQEKSVSMDDTRALLDAINHGKGFKSTPVMGGLAPARPAPPPSGPLANSQASKAPSTIKTNIKAANQVHPYQR